MNYIKETKVHVQRGKAFATHNRRIKVLGVTVTL